MSNKIKVALYARFSTNMQREESITAQIRAMTKYCKERNWKIVEIYKDSGISGTTDKRPAFQQMITDSNEKKFNIVLVHKLDRFSRNRYDAAIYKRQLLRNGIKLCSVSENLNTSPESILLESLLEGIAEYYSANLATESLKGMKENAYQCKHTGGSTPLGYDLDENKRMIINEEEAKAVTLIYKLYLNGYGHQYIANFLNKEGYHTKSGASFKKTSFDVILKNEKYTGVFVFNKTASKGFDGKRNSRVAKADDEIIRIEGGCPAIISKDDFQQVQKKLKNRSLQPKPNTKYLYICTGKITCGCCKGNMKAYQRKGKISKIVYGCSSKKAECDNRKTVSAPALDRMVVEFLEEKVFSSSQSSAVKKDGKRLKELSLNEPEYRTIIQKYIHRIIVNKNCAIFEIIDENGKIIRRMRQRSSLK